MNTELVLTIKDFEQRYGIARSNVYNRINGLRDKGYQIDPAKQGTRSFFSPEQIEIMDQLDEHLKRGNDIATFPNSNGLVEMSYQPTGRSIEHPVNRQDSISAVLGVATLIDAIAGKVADIVSNQDRLRMSPSDPTANLRALEEAANKGWLLSSSQLAPLLGLKTLSGKQIERFGFRCIRAGRNGPQSAWKITKGTYWQSPERLDDEHDDQGFDRFLQAAIRLDDEHDDQEIERAYQQSLVTGPDLD